jgi:metallo-beta-lactamase family protein
MNITFLGSTETVTGSKHLITTDNGYTVLLDCGLFQGEGKESDEKNKHLGFNPILINSAILSHAHIDHSGNFPLMVKQGFEGNIYCTPATFDVVSVLLMDSAKIHESDAEFINKKRAKNNLPPIKPLYTSSDVEKCLLQFKTVSLNTDFVLNNEVSFKFTDAGHILGSAVVNLKIQSKKGETIRVAFSGDVGRYNDMILKSPDRFPQADYIICESTYGDRLHESDPDFEFRFLNIVRKTCVEKKGKLIIPAFSLGRTQEIVFMLDKLKNKGLLPKIKVFVDSPLSTNITNIMRQYVNLFNENIQEYIKTDSDPFGFNNLTYIRDKEESMALNDLTEPCIIISASGMMDAGRIKHHLANNISSSKNTVLVTGYCSPNSLGAQIREKQSKVKIFGEYFDLNADVEIMDSFSAHADYSELIRFLSCQKKNDVKTIFLVHGDGDAKLSFKEKLIKFGFKDVKIPRKNYIADLQ